MLNERIEKLRSELKVALKESYQIENPIEKLTAAMGLIERAINGLDDLMEMEDFENSVQEIHFFKAVKPQVVALKIEEIVNYNIELNKPIGSVESEVKYYKREIETMQSFFRKNAFHYQYYKTEATGFDELFFLRSSGPLPVPSSEFQLDDHPHTTPMSYLFAKFIAYEHIQNQLREKIFELNNPECRKFKHADDRAAGLRWTGDLVNMVELIYGLFLTGQLNDGNASLSEIVRWVESNLDIRIGVIQKRFAEIESRKRISPTKFLDQMQEFVLRKIAAGRA
jgi:hypothetical protein